MPDPRRYDPNCPRCQGFGQLTPRDDSPECDCSDDPRPASDPQRVQETRVRALLDSLGIMAGDGLGPFSLDAIRYAYEEYLALLTDRAALVAENERLRARIAALTRDGERLIEARMALEEINKELRDTEDVFVSVDRCRSWSAALFRTWRADDRRAALSAPSPIEPAAPTVTIRECCAMDAATCDCVNQQPAITVDRLP